MELVAWWLAETAAGWLVWRYVRRGAVIVLGLILGKRYRTLRADMAAFERDRGRGDVVARLIARAPDFRRAEAKFERWAFSPDRRATKLAFSAMVDRLRSEGRTPETVCFLKKHHAWEESEEWLPPALENDPHRYEWAVMLFENDESDSS